jgi:hypothetical protein
VRGRAHSRYTTIMWRSARVRLGCTLSVYLKHVATHTANNLVRTERTLSGMTDLVLCVLLWWGVGTAMHGQFHFFFLAKGPQLLSLSVAPRMKITAWNISHHHRIACGHAERTTLGRPHECEVMRSNVLQQGPLRLQDGPDLFFFPIPCTRSTH